VTLLVLAGALNGLILPVGFAVILWVAARRTDLLRGYRYPRWLLVIGVLVWGLTVYLGWNSLSGIAALW
jgi:Mn2+/Fe2+ NRAMP family transporter